MARLSNAHKEALETPEGSKVLVQELNQQMITLKKTIIATQDELGVYQNKFHETDKDNSVLSSKLEMFVGVEAIKYLLSAVGTGYGVNLISDQNNSGYIFIVASGILYIALTFWQNRKLHK